MYIVHVHIIEILYCLLSDKNVYVHYLGLI